MSNPYSVNVKGKSGKGQVTIICCHKFFAGRFGSRPGDFPAKGGKGSFPQQSDRNAPPGSDRIFWGGKV